MKLIYHKKAFGVPVSYQDSKIIIKNTEKKNCFFFDLESLKISKTLKYKSPSFTSCQSYQGKHYIFDHPRLIIYSALLKREKVIKSVFDFSNDLFFRKGEVLNPDKHYFINVFSSTDEEKELFQIKGGRWNKIVTTDQLLFVYSKFSTKRQIATLTNNLLKAKDKNKDFENHHSQEKENSLRVYDKKSGCLLNEIKGSFSPCPIANGTSIFYDDEYCYLHCPQTLLKFSQKDGRCIWKFNTGEIHDISFKERKIFLSKFDGLFELVESKDEPLKLKPIILVPEKVINHENQAEHLIGHYNEKYFIGTRISSFTGIFIKGESENKKVEKLFHKRNYKEYLPSSISNFYFYKDKLIVFDFKSNFCVFEMNTI